MQTAFGAELREWRVRRRVSQLDLGLAANVSARHISFLETGRSRPSRSMVLHLCDHLEVPRTARNGLLNAAGFAPAYGARSLDETDMAPVREALDWTLMRHDPFPAIALDRHWIVVRLNRSAALLLAAIGVGEGGSLLEAATDPTRLAPLVENWPEVARHFIVRLRTESAHLGGDPLLDSAADALQSQAGPGAAPGEGPLPAVMPTRYRAGETVLSFFSTIAHFGSAEDIALADLKIELMFPADAATRQALQGLAETEA